MNVVSEVKHKKYFISFFRTDTVPVSIDKKFGKLSLHVLLLICLFAHLFILKDTPHLGPNGFIVELEHFRGIQQFSLDSCKKTSCARRLYWCSPTNRTCRTP
jgi:hypothetical protein